MKILLDMKRNFLILLMLCLSATAYSQLNPMGSIYYQNQYLANPAMAGIEKGFELNAGYKAQWTAIEGAPTMQSVTGTYGSNSGKVGLGLAFYNENAGVIQRTSFKGTYAYHLPLNNDDSFLDFGLSAGFMNEWIDFGKVSGNQSDLSLANFNQRKAYFDGDFGFAFRNRRLNIQGSLPNLKSLFDRDFSRNVVDRSLYFAAVGYKFFNPSGVLSLVEPKVAYRGVQNYKDIVDVGVNAQFWGNKLFLNTIYHSTNSVSVGVGTTYQNRLNILAMYTSNTSDLQNYSNGEFEVSLKYNFR
ncbi:PorP/SprF family type IX secretion system membrane protein [Pedobacter sp. MW01-1-1]|uniref:PorP/SprF family type IX secretion system membrane protein n=1 Tax=Pedobacter sp. MW01-1-1 TaxID=3383027 RepID=UPI003FED5B16